jgi:hypothetical protein
MEQWTDGLTYEFTMEAPPQIAMMVGMFDQLANKLVQSGHEPGEVLTAIMNATVTVALKAAGSHQVHQKDVMMMVAHYFMNAAQYHAPERFQ